MDLFIQVFSSLSLMFYYFTVVLFMIGEGFSGDVFTSRKELVLCFIPFYLWVIKFKKMYNKIGTMPNKR